MNINYFGYGAMANPSIMQTLLGRLPKYNDHSKLDGWSLVIQNLNHLPNIPKLHDEVEINPQELMRQIWGSEFRSYGIVLNPTGIVHGTVWYSLTPTERKLLNEWELIPWGWLKDVSGVRVRATDLISCCTESIGDDQDYDRELGFITDPNPPLLMPEADVIKHAITVNEEFFNRFCK